MELLLTWLSGCGASPADTDVVPALTSPRITAFDWACDVDEDAWTLAVEASSWSGGGALWLTSDGSYVEQHAIRVTRDEPDGSGETLALELGIVSDWRDQASGSSTAFLCTNAPALRFQLDERSGEPADCRFDGEPGVWAGVPDAPSCDTPWHD